MATYEEKILAYLDDSLSGEEREDVRAQIAGGDARATRLLNAHVRLSGLYALAATPVSAPLAIQRELASKVPVLALKLPYLATPEKRRKRAAGWFWELPSFRMNAMLVLLAALLAGGIWFALRGGHSGNGSRSFSIKPNATGGSSSLGSAPQNATPTNPNAEAAVASSRTSPLKAAHSSNFSSKTYQSDLSHRTNPAHSLKSQRTFPTRGYPPKLQSATPPEPATVKEPDISQKMPDEVPPSVVMQMEPYILTTDVSQPPAMFHAAGAIPIPINPEQANSYAPVRAFVEENIRSTRLSPQVRPSDFARRYGVWQSSVTTENPELGIDYEISPWIAIGIRTGDARFIQEQQVAHLESKSGGYSHLTSEVIETALLDPFATWACAAATYTPNPGERLEYSFTAAAGDIFITGFSPTLLGEAAATYKASNAFALRASFSYQAAWMANASPVSISSSNSISSVSGSSVQSVTTKLYPSQSLGLSVGVMFHP